MLVCRFLAVAALSLCGVAQASTTLWDFNSQNAPITDGIHRPGNYVEMTLDGVTMRLSAWSDSKNDYHYCDNQHSATCASNPDKYDTNHDPFIEQASLAYYQSGRNLGINNQDEASPGYDAGNSQHSIDNMPDRTSHGYNDFDMVLVEFSEAVSLAGLYSGWESSNNGARGADVSVLAYTGLNFLGNNAFSPSAGHSVSWSDLLNQSWDVVGNFASVENNYAISTPIESNYWLIGAYNPVFNSGPTDPGVDFGDDGFKLGKISTRHSVNNNTPTSVAEPEHTLAMVLGVMLIGLHRRRSR